MACLPSVLAAGSISAAANGLLGHVWCGRVNLLHTLQRLTNADIVRIACLLLDSGVGVAGE